jgi:hypothetical protein
MGDLSASHAEMNIYAGIPIRRAPINAPAPEYSRICGGLLPQLFVPQRWYDLTGIPW